MAKLPLVITMRNGFLWLGLVGFLATSCLQVIAWISAPGESGIAAIFVAPYLIILTPADYLCGIVGWHWQLGSAAEVTLLMFLALGFINFILCGLLGIAGSLIVFLFRKLK